jgi:hypothetical protein
VCETLRTDQPFVWKQKGLKNGFFGRNFEILKDFFLLMLRRGTKPQERWLSTQVHSRVLTGTNSEGKDKLMKA